MITNKRGFKSMRFKALGETFKLLNDTRMYVLLTHIELESVVN